MSDNDNMQAIHQIAKDLGFECFEERHQGRAALIRRADGLALFFNTAWNAKDGQMTVSLSMEGGLFEHYRYNERGPEINLKVTKKGAAADLRRRLLEDAEAMHLILTERKKVHDERQDKTNVVLERFEGAGLVTPQHENYPRENERDIRTRDAYGSVYVTYGAERANLKLNGLTIPQAEAILTILKETK